MRLNVVNKDSCMCNILKSAKGVFSIYDKDMVKKAKEALTDPKTPIRHRASWLSYMYYGIHGKNPNIDYDRYKEVQLALSTYLNLDRNEFLYAIKSKDSGISDQIWIALYMGDIMLGGMNNETIDKAMDWIINLKL